MTKPFELRGFSPCESLLRHTPEQLRNFIRRMKKLQMNTLLIHSAYGWNYYKDLVMEECSKSGIKILLYTLGARSFFSYVECKPHWFAKDVTGKPFNEKLECESYPCRFEEEALEAYEYGAKEWLKSVPAGIKHVHMRGADGIRFCQCPKCRVLPEFERWQPFAERFVKAIQEVRPDLEFGVDAYVKRLYIPENRAPYEKMSDIMFDTFDRHNEFPIDVSGYDIPRGDLDVIISSGIKEDEKDTNRFIRNRLKEWAEAFPGKPFIHENAMGQSYFTITQFATDSYLQDVDFYRRLGLKGIFWEAFEPGYGNFEEMFELLAKAMMGEEVKREPTKIELARREFPDTQFGGDLSFPLEKYIEDPWILKNKLLFRRYRLSPDFDIFREYFEFAWENEAKLDSLYIGYALLKNYYSDGIIKFKNLTPEEKDLFSRRKLWDYMEDIQSSCDPRKECREMMEKLFRKAERA